MDAVWSKSDQKMATKENTPTNFSSTLKPSLEKTSWVNDLPAGGTWMNSLLPNQKKKVASAIKTPGVPNAKCGPYHSSSQGMSMLETAAPRLIEK